MKKITALLLALALCLLAGCQNPKPSRWTSPGGMGSS